MENILKKRLAIIKARAKRLRRLHLSIETNGRAESGSAPIDSRSDLISSGPSDNTLVRQRLKDPRFIESDVDQSDADDWESGPLEDLVKGEEREVGGWNFYLVRQKDSEIDPCAGREALEFLSVDRGRYNGAGIRAGGRQVGPNPLEAPRERVCFFDIETTGLSTSTYIFLGGMMFLDGDKFLVEQAFARDYEEEGGVLRYIQNRFGAFDAIVTYNGRTFDLPFVRARMAVNRIGFDENFFHLDLLSFARRAYSGFLENCRLETVERHLRSRDRVGDIPGSQIPNAYHAYVMTGEAALVKRVLYHNRMDLLSMAILYNQLWPRKRRS
ncbi:MAG: hypothetical protein GTO51_07215 [Candidatus Latescibacteria bacterium]|nr:hypothetical protein [Candidatus Latescibacterota bacterium]NIM22283.1 hypothetical protein [Candidatus Latescibacterota bacterium]NIM65762.1 hypothetical protein [Candidatus Latescibacterota bacterium]NIO02147.1 hypothetical protein [Candidatus Latescibacterota bacterium]NIO28979.1 hypothetical protein [Candidatus Latescibacterota bacterium]